MLQVLPCPHCSQFSLILEETAADSEIRCPNCLTQFTLGELSSKFSVWEVVRADQFTASTSSLEAAQSRADSDSELVVQDVVSDSPPMQSAAKKSSDAEINWKSFEPITHEQFERLKRKTRSPIWTVLQVAVGGLAAVPVSLLIMWHVLGKDLIDAGPSVARYVPWIVPEQFHPLAIPELEANSSNRGQDSAEVDNSSRVDLSRSMATLAANDPTAPSDNEPSQVKQGGDAQSSEGTSEYPHDPATGAAPSEESLGLTDRNFIGHNVFAAISLCERDLEYWHQGLKTPEADKKQLARAMYSDLASLALLVGRLPKNESVIRVLRDQIQDLSRMIKRVPETVSMIQQGAKHSLSRSEIQTPSGLAVILEIGTLYEESGYWVVTPVEDVGNDESSSVRILIPKILAPTLIAKQQLLLLGTLTQEETSDSQSSLRFEASYVYSFGS
ncbi:MAG: hypothetical protein KDB22_11240 [Planctomycetales bacterium]|nr:hypothetical protein [Planctomycetales bacterium]